MTRPLQPGDVLERDPRAQAVALPDGRLLVRHRRGASLLAGVELHNLDRLLGLVDGVRTAAEVVAAAAALDPPFDEREARGLLRALFGEMVRRAELPANPTPNSEHRSVLVLGSSTFARALEESLRRAAPPTPIRRLDRLDPSDAFLQTASLVVCAAEGVSYRDLFADQSACLSLNLPAFFITADPDGLRVGPTVIPGLSPCITCAQLAATRFLGLDPSARLSAISNFEVHTVDPTARAWAERAVIAETLRILGPHGGEPTLVDAFLLLPTESFSSGEARRIPLARDPECPLCSQITAPPETDLTSPALLSIVEREESLPRAAISSIERGDLVRSVGIVGGGTAGYLTALALRRKVPDLRVTLIESPNHPVIGVGEATTPLMPQFLHADLGLDVHQLFAEVRPTLKLGIRFLWGEPEVGDFHYPFGPLHLLEPAVYGAAGSESDAGTSSLKSCSLPSLLMAADAVGLYRLGPDPNGEDSWAARLGTAVAYHLDNERFVAYLARRAAEAGIERIEATLEEVETRDDGSGGREVEALVALDGRRFGFDLYVDATGFRSLLIERALGSPWVSFDRSLWTDRAVVAPVPHGGHIRPYTTAETMSAGWCWSTPQGEADHRGYVFASAFQSFEEAEAEMRRANPGMGAAREVRFRTGRHEHFWRGNTMALGNAYGFVEPLESTALHLLIRQIGLLCQVFPLRHGDRSLAPLYDRKVGAWWDYLAWFLAIHYRFNRRLDAPFWRAARAEVDVSHRADLLEAFRQRGPLSYDPPIRDGFDYPDPLWGPEGIDAILLGQGVPCHLPHPRLPKEALRARLERARIAVARAAPHAQALRLLAERADLLERFVAPFRASGPAFSRG